MIKNIQKIIKDDISAALKNPVVLIVLIALIILPSLYSVINIYACWDPYEDTDNINFIIVNNDNPVTVNGTTYAYGDMVVDELKNRGISEDNIFYIYQALTTSTTFLISSSVITGEIGRLIIVLCISSVIG